MHIALINHEVPPIASGVGSYVFDLANVLSAEVKVTVISGNYGNSDLFEHKNRNLNVYKLSTPQIAPRFVWFQLKNREKIRRILNKDKIDIFHGQGTACAFLLNNSVFKKPKIVTQHGDPRQDFIQFNRSPVKYQLSNEFFQYGVAYPLWYTLSKREYIKADKVITFSHYVETSLQKTFNTNKHASILPQGINLTKILTILDSKEKIEKDNSLFFSGRLIWRKGIIYLLRAFEKVHSEIPDLKLKIFGDGPLKETINDFIKTRKLDKNIFCHGYVPYSVLLTEICKSHFAVLPSLFEASSIMMLEVMACKRPLLAFDLPFLQEDFKHMYNAYLTPLDEKALANSIIKLYYDESLRDKLSMNGYQYVSKHHNWKRIVNDYLDIYDSF